MEDYNKYYLKLYNWLADIPQSEIDKLVIRQFEANETFIHKDHLFTHILLFLTASAMS